MDAGTLLLLRRVDTLNSSSSSSFFISLVKLASFYTDFLGVQRNNVPESHFESHPLQLPDAHTHVCAHARCGSMTKHWKTWKRYGREMTPPPSPFAFIRLGARRAAPHRRSRRATTAAAGLWTQHEVDISTIIHGASAPLLSTHFVVVCFCVYCWSGVSSRSSWLNLICVIFILWPEREKRRSCW